MKIVRLTDDHPGKWNDGVKVVLCEAVCESFAGEEPFLTGFRSDGVDQEKCGMFDKDFEPVQVIRAEGDGYHLSMANCATIARHEIDELLKHGEIVLPWGIENEGLKIRVL